MARFTKNNTTITLMLANILINGDYMYNITFLNGQNDSNNLEEAGRNSLDNFLSCLEFWHDNGTDLDSYEYSDYSRRELISEFSYLGSFSEIKEKVREIEGIVKGFTHDCGDLHDYGLCFDFVEADESHDGFYRFQISWGGPSSECRFYPNGDIEYVYMDWFCGVGFNLNGDSNARWLREYFSECGMLDFESKDYEELYQDFHLTEEAEEDE